MPIYTTIIYVLCGALMLSLGILTISKDSKFVYNKIFFLFTLSIILWWIFMYLGYFFTNDSQLATIFFRLTYGFPALGFIFLTIFFYIFPRKDIHYPKSIEILYICIGAIIFILSSFTPYIYENLIINQNTSLDTFGSLYLIYPLWFVLNFLLIVFLGVKKSFQFRSLEKKKIVLATWGMGISGFLSIITNAILPFFGISVLQEEVPLFILFFIIPTFYSIQKYRFLDIKSTISTTTKVIVSLVISFFLTYFFYQEISNFWYTLDIFYVYLISVLLSVGFYTKIFQFLNSQMFHRYFGVTNLEFFKQVLDEFENKNIVYTNLKTLEKDLHETFCEKIGIESEKIIVLDSKNKKYYQKLTDQFQISDKILATKEIQFFEDQEKKKSPFVFFSELKDLGEVCVPLINSSGGLLGFFVLGKKRFDDMYTKEELDLLEKLKLQLSLTLTGLIYSSELEKEVALQTKKLTLKTKELEKAYEKLQEFDNAKDSFLSIASHELRTPMTVIKGYSEFLLSEKFGTLNEKQKDFQNKIFNNTQQLLLLVNDLLDLSKLEAGKMTFSYEKIQVASYIEETLSNLRVLCQQKHIDLTMEIEPKIKEMCTDPDKIKRILTNLVGNAYKFTPEKGTISVKLEDWKGKEKKEFLEEQDRLLHTHFKIKNEDFVKFQVRDTGVGIAKENFHKVFEKFSQVSNYLQKQYNGTGLGLPIVKKIIEKMGGKIWLESEIGKGSDFIFVIPRESHDEEVLKNQEVLKLEAKKRAKKIDPVLKKKDEKKGK